jgi:hypothetical protein
MIHADNLERTNRGAEVWHIGVVLLVYRALYHTQNSQIRHNLPVIHTAVWHVWGSHSECTTSVWDYKAGT